MDETATCCGCKLLTWINDLIEVSRWPDPSDWYHIRCLPHNIAASMGLVPVRPMSQLDIEAALYTNFVRFVEQGGRNGPVHD